MSFQATAWACKVKTGSPAAKAILMMIANYMAPHDDEADGFLCGFPGQEILAEESEMSLRSARDHIRGLVERGLLQKKMRFLRGARTSDWYRIPVKSDGSVHQFPLTEDASASKDWPSLVDEKVNKSEDDNRQDSPPADLAGGNSASDHRQTVAGYKGEDQLDTNIKKKTSSFSSSEIASRPSDAEPVRQDVEKLCELLANLIAVNDENHKKPKITKGWRDAARLLMDRDGRSYAQVENMIRWSQNHSFWHTNILSMPTLRKQYTQMRLQAMAEHDGRSYAPRRHVPYRNPVDASAYEGAF